MTSPGMSEREDLGKKNKKKTRRGEWKSRARSEAAARQLVPETYFFFFSYGEGSSSGAKINEDKKVRQPCVLLRESRE